MKFNDYLKDKYFSIILAVFETLLVGLMLKCFNLEYYLILIIVLLNLITGLFILIYNYSKKYKFYNLMIDNLSKLDIECKTDNSLSDASRFELFILNLVKKDNYASN